jgi:hypothetical protein
LAQFQAYPPQRPTLIHVFNKSEHFGSGDIYRTDQPHYLLMNIPKDNITMWTEESPSAVIPKPLSLCEWLEAEQIDLSVFPSQDYLPRAVVGAYLQYGFRQLLNHLPGGITCECTVGEVVRIKRRESGFALSWRPADGSFIFPAIHYRQVLLATGHPLGEMDEEDRKYAKFSRLTDGVSFVKTVYPVGRLDVIPARETVAIKGMGLTFTDTALALTEGRGGRFIRDAENGNLTYLPSGQEPRTIYPFSRSGLPMIPRCKTEYPYTLRFITEEVAISSDAEKVNFRESWWPLIEAEYLWAYYLPYLQEHRSELIESKVLSISELKEAIAELHRKETNIDPFDLEIWLNPLRNQNFERPEELHCRLIRLISENISLLKAEGSYCQLAALTSVWSRITPIFRTLYNFGGLRPDSQRAFDEEISGKLQRVSYGPPLINMEKILALAAAGYLCFHIGNGAEIHPDDAEQAFVIRAHSPATDLRVKHLIDARIPRPRLSRTTYGLYTDLLKQELITPFTNRSGEHLPYRPGCPDINECGFVRYPDGRYSRDLAITGAPGEGITFDNDSLFRQVNNTVSGWAEQVRRCCLNPI